MEQFILEGSVDLSSAKIKPGAPLGRDIASSSKLNYPILEYQEKCKSNFLLLKSSLTNIHANITNYKNEINKLEDFLIKINEHEKNYKLIQKKFEALRKNLEETIDIENLISKLSSNQQIINMSEYVNLYKRVKKIMKFFSEQHLQDKDDYVLNMKKMMYRGFKVYEDAFYVILKRYDQLEFSQVEENEKLNLLNKIRNLAKCLQDEEIKFDFTKNLIEDRSEKISIRLDDLKINCSKLMNEENYSINSGIVTILLIESSKLFSGQKAYIYEILEECDEKIKSRVYKNIIEQPLQKILQNLKELTLKHTKSNIKRHDFYQSLDVLNSWQDTSYGFYKHLVGPYHPDIFENINDIVKSIGIFCFNYVDNFLKEINNLNEKIENENVLKICNDTIFFLSTLLNFENAFEYIGDYYKSEYQTELNAEVFLHSLITRLETKASLLDKKYPPLKFILLINNVFFIQSKISLPPFSKFIGKDFIETLNKNITCYIEGYLRACWGKVDDITFNDSEKLMYESDGRILKGASREYVKKRFAAFNDAMKLHLKVQQHIQIIDRSLESTLINENIKYLCERYDAFFMQYNNIGFTKFRNKYIIYTSGSDIMQDLKLYFMADTVGAIK